MSSLTIGAIAAIVIVVALVLAFTGLPFRGGYELKAVFSTSQNIAKGSPVRVAGVEVGDHEHGTAPSETFERGPDQTLALRIEARRRLVQDEHGRVL